MYNLDKIQNLKACVQLHVSGAQRLLATVFNAQFGVSVCVCVGGGGEVAPIDGLHKDLLPKKYIFDILVMAHTYRVSIF